LIARLKAGETPEAIAKKLRRTPSSAHQKAGELGLLKTAMGLTHEQEQAKIEAARQRSLSERCKELATVAGLEELANRLNAMATEYHEKAWAVEAKAGLPLARDEPRK
jgi:hypothetical protein